MPKRTQLLLVCMLFAFLLWTGCWISPSDQGEPSKMPADEESVSDQTAPEIRLIYPRDGAVLSGKITITAEAADDTEILCVEFFIDGIQPANGAEYNLPYECAWETNPLEEPSIHFIHARATDTSDNISYSDTVAIIVNNSSSNSAEVVLNQDLNGILIFPPDNWWNLDISAAPLEAQSDAVINWIGSSRRLHPDFGVPPYGIPYVCVSSGQQLVPVDFYKYQSESDPGAPGRPNGYPIPSIAFQQPNYIEGGDPGGGDTGDRHMIIIDRDNLFLFETYGTTWNSYSQIWEAACGATFDLTTNDRRPEGWASADAAGLAIFPGLVKYDEVYGAEEIQHAFRFTTRSSNGYVWPASHEAGSTSGAPPLGMRIRLKASFNISGYPAPIQKILRAMKRYGLILADNGSDMFIQGTMDMRWDSGVLNDAIHSLYANDFEVIQFGWQPTASGIPVDENNPGTISDELK